MLAMSKKKAAANDGSRSIRISKAAMQAIQAFCASFREYPPGPRRVVRRVG